MNALNNQGQYELTDFDAEILDLFAAEYATEAETAAESSVFIKQMPTLRIHIQRLPQLFIKNTKLLQVMWLRP